MYVVINCPTCGKIILANTADKTRLCPHCESKIPILGTRILARSRTTQEAVDIIQHLKSKKNKDDHAITFKKFKG